MTCTPAADDPEIPRAVRYLLDGYGKESIKSWTDDACPRVSMAPDAWSAAVSSAAESGDVRSMVTNVSEAGVMLGARIRVGDDGDEVRVGTWVEAGDSCDVVVNW